MCKKRNLKVNATKSKVLVFERNSNTECTILLDGQGMESVRTFKYLGSIMSKDGRMVDEVRERGPNKGKGW